MKEESKKYVSLKASMIPNAMKLLSIVNPTTIDTGILLKFESLPKDGIVDAFNASKYATEALEACSIAKLYCRVCKAFALAAKTELARIEAVKYFESEAKLTTKVTEGSKTAFVSMDEKVINIKDKKNSWEVLSDYFENSMYEFRDRHCWFKNIFDKDMQTGENIERQDK